MVNKWGEWINLNWNYSINWARKTMTNNKTIDKMPFKGGDVVELEDGRIAIVQECNYYGHCKLEDRPLFSIIVSIGSKLIFLNNPKKLRKVIDAISRCETQLGSNPCELQRTMCN